MQERQIQEALPKYLTVDGFISRLGDEAIQLAGIGLRDNRSIDRAKLAAELIHADGVIDGYVRARYPRPFVVVPEVLKGVSHDIARYRLRAVGGQQSSQAEAVKDQYAEAMRLLRDIADGRLVLDAGIDDTAATHATNTISGAMPAARMPGILEGW